MNRVLKTKDYDIFKFREDNRQGGVKKKHVEFLKNSIQMRNMLELRPILVNSEMQVMDGQHRLEAAKELGIDIYYMIDDEMKGSDIILMNIAKAWTMVDYLNYYVKNNYAEYIKFNEYIIDHDINVTVGLKILDGESENKTYLFKIGKFKFNDSLINEDMNRCWRTINFIKKMNGTSSYTRSGKFWIALLNLIKHQDFNYDKWISNLNKMPDRFGPRVTVMEYHKMMTDIYNYQNKNKLDLNNPER